MQDFVHQPYLGFVFVESCGAGCGLLVLGSLQGCLGLMVSGVQGSRV